MAYEDLDRGLKSIDVNDFAEAVIRRANVKRSNPDPEQMDSLSAINDEFPAFVEGAMMAYNILQTRGFSDRDAAVAQFGFLLAAESLKELVDIGKMDGTLTDTPPAE